MKRRGKPPARPVALYGDRSLSEFWGQIAEGEDGDATTDRLWCLHCETVGRVSEVRVITHRDGFEFLSCPDPKCNGAGPYFDLFPWREGYDFVPWQAGAAVGDVVSHYKP